MRRSWPDRPDDYVFRIDGKDAGRCYLTVATASRHVWLWTVYGRATRGMEETLEQAQRRFKGATGADN